MSYNNNKFHVYMSVGSAKDIKMDPVFLALVPEMSVLDFYGEFYDDYYDKVEKQVHSSYNEIFLQSMCNQGFMKVVGQRSKKRLLNEDFTDYIFSNRCTTLMKHKRDLKADVCFEIRKREQRRAHKELYKLHLRNVIDEKWLIPEIVKFI